MPPRPLPFHLPVGPSCHARGHFLCGLSPFGGGHTPWGGGALGRRGVLTPSGSIPWGVAFGVVSEGQGVKWLSECWFLHKERRGGPEPPLVVPGELAPAKPASTGGRPTPCKVMLASTGPEAHFLWGGGHFAASISF